MTDITDLTDAELDALLDRKVQAVLLRRLNRLTRAELAALGDRAGRRCPNPIHLASALAKLDAPGPVARPRPAPGPLAGQTPRRYRTRAS